MFGYTPLKWSVDTIFSTFSVGEIVRQISRKLLTLAEEDKLQNLMRLPQERFAKFSIFFLIKNCHG